MKKSVFLPWSLLIGFCYFMSGADAARATTLILGKSKPEPKIDVLPTAEEGNASVSLSGSAAGNLVSNETLNAGNVTTKLTGVPQIDYIYDPNLPRELNGYNLTDYPFYNAVPEDIDFKCDGLHDGFYASVPHKCQVYHHCLFGTRYDFLCANYTAFDQKTFICHFASEVDCKNSPRYFNRNEALYKAASTTTVAPFGGFATKRPPQDSPGGRRRRPHRKKKPSYDYYDEYEDAAEDDYYDEGASRRRKRPRTHGGRDSLDQAEEEEAEDEKGPQPTTPNKSVFDRPRIAPKIRRPVPVNERDKYDYGTDARAIIKEPTVEKKKVEDSESTRKQQSGKEYHEGGGKSKEADTEREREREHRQEDGYESERERERESERERLRELERERERERDRDRDRDERPYRERRPFKKRRRPEDIEDEYDDYEDVRRYRPSGGRTRSRYEEYDEYEYDERPYRRNREPEYRVRDYEYDRDKPYRSRDFEYERPRNRDRLRDEDRSVRNRDLEERPSRNREEERLVRGRDEDRVRIRDQDKGSEDRTAYRSDPKGGKNRNRDSYYDQDRYRERNAEESRKTKDVFREKLPETVKDDRTHRYKEEEPETRVRDQERNSQERPFRYKGRMPARGEASSEEEAKATEQFGGGRARPGADQGPWEGERGGLRQQPRPRLPPVPPEPVAGESDAGRTKSRGDPRPDSPPSLSDEVSEQAKPVPAARPAFITKPPESVLLQSFTRRPIPTEPVDKKPFYKRPVLRVPTADDEPEEIPKRDPGNPYDGLPIREPQQEEPQQPPQYGVQDEYKLENRFQHSQPETQADLVTAPKLRVPQEEEEEEVEEDEGPISGDLAPRAPKTPQQTIPRRRPFLPSRNGNGNLPRGLLPVGSKALPASRDPEPEARPSASYEVNEDREAAERGQAPGYDRDGSGSSGAGGAIEFRAKLSAAIGVDQPKLAQFYQEVQSPRDLELGHYEEHPGPPDDGFYSSQKTEAQDLSGTHVAPEYRPDGYRHNAKPVNFPEGDAPPPPFRNRQSPSLINQQPQVTHFGPKDAIVYAPPPPPPVGETPNHPAAPPTFYSDNPKFKTTVKLSPAPSFPLPKGMFVQMGHLQLAPAGHHPGAVRHPVVRSHDQQHRQDGLKFPTQSGDSLGEPDDFDVSLNDALQPISSLHPRNVGAATGIYSGAQGQQRQQGAPGLRRRSHQEEVGSEAGAGSRGAQESRNVPNQPKRFGMQRAASSILKRFVLSPFFQQISRPATEPGKFVAILN